MNEYLIVGLFICIFVIIALLITVNNLNKTIGQIKKHNNDELNILRNNTEKSIYCKARAELKEWKLSNEKLIRQDAINRSKSVIKGQIAEQLIPFSSVFPYNPKDAIFLGNPIDYIIFNGLSNNDIKDIQFVEVKTGKSNLNTRQRKIKEIILNKMVSWNTIKI